MKYWTSLSEIEMWCVFAIGCVLILSAILAYLLEKKGIFVALSAVTSGLTRLFVQGTESADRAQAFLLITSGVIYLCLQLFLLLRAQIRTRREARAEIARRIAYTLPDRENTYVRSRLNTALFLPEKEVNADMGTSEDLQKGINLAYARRLLNHLREAPLSYAERLRTEELGRELRLYLLKEDWRVEDARAVNDLCAALLKLSGKYAV